MKKTGRVLITALGLLPITITLALFSLFPDEVPRSYNLFMEVERWGSKYELLIFPILVVLYGAFMYYLFYKSDENNLKAILSATAGSLVVINIVNVKFLSNTYSIIYDTRNTLTSETIFIKVLLISISLLFLLIGIYLPKSKQNIMIGVRTKWTLSSEEVWQETHNLAGKLLIIFSVLSIFVSLLITDPDDMILVYLYFALLVIPMITVGIYSYIIYKKHKND